MKYSQPNSSGKNIIHQFHSEGKHIIGGKHWSKVEMSFSELHSRSDIRNFIFTIRYGNPEDKEWRLNQFNMREDEIKQFLDIVHETVYNPPKFKEIYLIGDKFILPSIQVVEANGKCFKETTYTNVEATLANIIKLEGDTKYILHFDGHMVVVNKKSIEALNKL